MPRKINLIRYNNETVQEQQGGGIFDVVVDTIFNTGKKVLPKAIEKGTTIAAEKIGNKTGEIVADKLHNRFMKPKVQDMMGASEIAKELQKLSTNKKTNNKTTDRDLANTFDNILNI